VVKLYSYFRSSAAYRVRIALNLKGLAYDYLPVNLLEKEQKSEEYLAHNPQGLVPALTTDNGEIIAQSVAILEWLEETQPQPALLPTDPLARARVRSLVNNITCDVHPLCNISVTNYLRSTHEVDRDGIIAWYCTWMHRGFNAVETAITASNSTFSLGDTPSFADICLVPQVYNADRFSIPMEAFPNIRRVIDNCKALSAFAEAAPEAQPDAPE
jgi:maleylacetoacetate isomerase